VSPGVEPLPTGTILLHIGPYKTGTTAIQQSLFDQRAVLAEHGVHYPGAWRRLFREGHSLLRWAPRGRPVPPLSVWEDFAAGIRARSETVCISTEDFGRLFDPTRSRKIVADLGADRLHVLAVARAYHRLLPSHWQERIKSNETLTYDEWLHQVFEGDDSMSAHRSFWTSHDIERMAPQWLELLPPDRFTVVVSDDSDRLLLSGVFEQLLDLPQGLLAPRGSANVSLSANAAEMVRRVNRVFNDRGWSDRDRRALIRHGVVRGLQAAGRSPEDVPMPTLPDWVRPLVDARSRARIEAIRALGLRVVGDLERLLPPDRLDPPDASAMAPETVAIRTTAAGVVGVFEAALRMHAPRATTEPDSRGVPSQPRAAQLSRVGDGAIVREVVRRLGRRLRDTRGVRSR